MTDPILPSRNESHGFCGTLTNCPLRERRSAEVWMLASRLIAATIRADSADKLIGIGDFLDSRMGRHVADDVVGALQGGAADSETAITSAIRKWQGWRISRQIQRHDGIPAGLPYRTGWVQHVAITAEMEDATERRPETQSDRSLRCRN